MADGLAWALARARPLAGAAPNQDSGTAVRWPRSLRSRHAARDRSGWAGAGGVTQSSRRLALQRVAQGPGEKRATVEEGAAAPGRKRLCIVSERSVRVGQWPACVHDRCGRGSDVWRGVRCDGDDLSVGRRHPCFCRRHCRPGRRCRWMRRCDRRLRRLVRRGGWYWPRRCGRRRIGLGVSERGADAVPQVGKHCLGIRDARFGRHDLIDVLGECGDQQLQGLGIAVLERRVENRTGLRAELGECLRGEWYVALAETCGAATAGAQRREPGRQGQRGRESGAGPARKRDPPGRRGLPILRPGVVAAGSRGGRAAQGAGEGDAADNSAAHRAAEAADEARTNPLAGLGGTAGCVERDRHQESIMGILSFRKRGFARHHDFFLGEARGILLGRSGRACRTGF